LETAGQGLAAERENHQGTVFSQMMLAKFMGYLTGRAFGPPPRVQFAALPYRLAEDGVEYLLVTSRDTARWIIPKGWPLKSGRVEETVMTEAWEEAGIHGRMHGEPVGEFSYEKRLENHTVPCRAVIYPVLVTKLAEDFPEKSERRREWLTAAMAAERVQEPELSDLFESGQLDSIIKEIEPSA